MGDDTGSSTPTPLTSAQRARFSRDLARKGMEVNERLTRLLAGQNARLLDLKLPHEQRPGLRPEERLRRYLDQIIRAQRRLHTDAWGHCDVCGAAFAPGVLEDTPWTEVCATCEVSEGQWDL